MRDAMPPVVPRIRKIVMSRMVPFPSQIQTKQRAALATHDERLTAWYG